MALIVQKFGGSSVANTERIHSVAKRIKKTFEDGDHPVVVVSAMGKETDRLVELAYDLGLRDYPSKSSLPSHMPPQTDGFWAEYDAVISTGENVTAGLLALCLQKENLCARSFNAHQLPIHTNNIYGKAHITDVDTTALKALIDKGGIPIITGFQGICPHGRVTTLSRGGTDTSAVAVAVALKAKRCDIYTDVDGIYSADPSIEPNAKKLDHITLEEILEMASLGANVLHVRCLNLAHYHHMPLACSIQF